MSVVVVVTTLRLQCSNCWMLDTSCFIRPSTFRPPLGFQVKIFSLVSYDMVIRPICEELMASKAKVRIWQSLKGNLRCAEFVRKPWMNSVLRRPEMSRGRRINILLSWRGALERLIEINCADCTRNFASFEWLNAIQMQSTRCLIAFVNGFICHHFFFLRSSYAFFGESVPNANGVQSATSQIVIKPAVWAQIIPVWREAAYRSQGGISLGASPLGLDLRSNPHVLNQLG